ncbi:MAG: outer membrane protein assembly factor BamD, partial [Gammaproteobacteria bacterium HGW-Gammaproteobacteria-8]
MRQLSLILILAALLQGCGGNKEREDEVDAEQLYQEARKVLAARDFQTAVQLYRNLTIRFPFGRHAEQANLDMAYAQYKGGMPEAAIATLDRFIKTFPTHPNVD